MLVALYETVTKLSKKNSYVSVSKVRVGYINPHCSSSTHVIKTVNALYFLNYRNCWCAVHSLLVLLFMPAEPCVRVDIDPPSLAARSSLGLTH